MKVLAFLGRIRRRPGLCRLPRNWSDAAQASPPDTRPRSGFDRSAGAVKAGSSPVFELSFWRLAAEGGIQ